MRSISRNCPECKGLNKFLSRVYFVHQKQTFFLYIYTHTHYFNIGETVHIGVETRRTRSSNVSRSDSRQWICTHPVDGAVYRTIPRPTSSRRDTRTCVYGQSQGVLWSNARGEKERDRYIYIKARFFRLDQNQQILPRNKRTPSLFIRSRDRTSFRTFHHRCVPSRRRNSSQTFRKILWNIQFSYFYLNLEKSYNIYKIIFYINIIYFITFSFVNNSLKSILKI